MTLIRFAIAQLCLVLICHPAQAAEHLYRDQPSVTPALAMPGPHRVGVRTAHIRRPEWLDATDFTTRSERRLTLEIWYPASVRPGAPQATYKDVTRTHQPFELQGRAYRDADAAVDTPLPLIVLSHGYTGYRSIMFYLAEHLASHGYLVAAIDHRDSTNAEIDMAVDAGAGFMSTLYNRAADQQFVLDHLADRGAQEFGLVIGDRAGVIGYSMGGYGAINTVGGCFAFSAPLLEGLGVPAEHAQALAPVLSTCNGHRNSTDPRWHAMIAIAPWGGEQGVHDQAAMARIRTPSLFIAGEEDDISGYENGVRKLFEQTGGEYKYLMVYENARHNIAAHPAPKVSYSNELDLGHYFEPAWDTVNINRINQHMVLAFLDCHLKGIEERCEYLPRRQEVTQTRTAGGGLNEPWPGFPARWGTGIRFYRE